jgi:hypothetical protein
LPFHDRSLATGSIDAGGERPTKITLESEDAMTDINTALTASREAIEQMITAGPATAAEGRRRLETAHQTFDEACRQVASQDVRIRTMIFGAVPVEDYARFMELHTRHHGKQMAQTDGK